MTNYPVKTGQEKAGKSRSFGGADAVVMLNQTYKADMGRLMATKRSHCDVGTPSITIRSGNMRSLVSAKRARAFRRMASVFPGRRIREKYTAHDFAKANKMLDDLGLTKRDAQGIRLLPKRQAGHARDQRRPAFGACDVAQLVAKDWEKVGIKTIVQIRERALHFKMRDPNELMTETWNDEHDRIPGGRAMPRWTCATR